VLALVMATTAAGCAGLRTEASDLGGDVVAAVREQEPELFDIEQRLADSMGAYLGRTVEDQVLLRARGTWDTMLLRLNEESRQVMGRVALGVERDVNRSLQVALDENLRLADSATRRLVVSALAGAREGAQPLIDDVMASLERGLRDRFRPVLLDVMNEVGDSLVSRIQVIDSTLAESRTGRRVSVLLYVVMATLGVIVIAGGLIWRRGERRHRQALQAAGAALQQLGAGQRAAVADELRSRGFGRQADWLR
jgi:hypothetical protein